MKIVISLGGSVIVPNHVDYTYLKNFKNLIKKFSKNNKIIIVTGGGSTCRNYLKPLEKSKLNKKVYSLIGIATTKLNARLVAGVFNITNIIPENIPQIKNQLKKSNIVVCGAIGFHKDMTSDGTATLIAKELKADFINITNVKGLYNKDPKLKGAKLIKNIDYKNFSKSIEKIKFKAGQHLILDQKAAKIIKQHKIKTYIIGKNLNNLNNLLKNKPFRGTRIQ